MIHRSVIDLATNIIAPKHYQVHHFHIENWDETNGVQDNYLKEKRDLCNIDKVEFVIT